MYGRFTQAGAGVAMANQTADVMTALVVDRFNRLNLLWVDGTGPWQAPIPFGPPNFNRTARIALCKQTDDILTAVLIDNNNSFNIAWVSGTGTWNGPGPVYGV